MTTTHPVVEAARQDAAADMRRIAEFNESIDLWRQREENARDMKIAHIEAKQRFIDSLGTPAWLPTLPM